MREKCVIIDTSAGMLFMAGPGGYELKLSPGTEAYHTEDSQARHMILPCSQWWDARWARRKD